MKKLRIVLIFILLALFLQALDLEHGSLRLTLNERYGRFSLQALKSDQAAQYRDLLYPAQQGRTTMLLVSLDNAAFIMGNSSAFRQSILQEGTENGFLWKSSTLEVKQMFSFLDSETMLLRIEVLNQSRRNLSIGLKYIFDTFLGEESPTHFITNLDSSISSEKKYHETLPNYWQSPGTDFSGLFVYLDHPLASKTDELIFANWKRMEENRSNWSFPYVEGRSFNYGIYSYNDSAVSHVYNPVTLKPGEVREVSIILGLKEASKLADIVTEDSPQISHIDSEEIQDTKDLEKDIVTIQSLHEGLQRINKILQDIDSILEKGDKVDEAELIFYENKLLELQEILKQYGEN